MIPAGPAVRCGPVLLPAVGNLIALPPGGSGHGALRVEDALRLQESAADRHHRQ